MATSQEPSYVPILTGKAGEFDALGDLDTEIVAMIAPFIDMPPLTQAKLELAPDGEIERLLCSVTKQWALGRRITVELTAYDAYPELDGMHAVERLVSRAEWSAAQLHLAAPTNATDRYLSVVKASMARVAGICVRARVVPDADPSVVAGDIERVLRELERSPRELDLLLDFGRLDDHPQVRIADLVAPVRSHLAAIPERDAWRSLVVAATDVPPNPIPRDNPRRVMRREWRVWQQLRREPDGRVPVHGDYSVTGPRPIEAVEGLPAPHLRYTTGSALLIWRGRRPDDIDPDDPPNTFPELCRELIEESDEYLGPSYSQGDRAFEEVLDPDASRGSGRPTDWVRYATSHHLTHVVRETEASP